MTSDIQERFDPCPLCKQYSHSLGEGQVAAAFNHFQSMIAHPLRGHPMGDAFDEQTQDAAQVLVTTIDSLRQTLAKCRELFYEIRMDWSDPRSECREGMALIDAALSDGKGVK